MILDDGVESLMGDQKMTMENMCANLTIVEDLRLMINEHQEEMMTNLTTLVKSGLGKLQQPEISVTSLLNSSLGELQLQQFMTQTLLPFINKTLVSDICISLQNLIALICCS